jgi:hypothetical protein
MFTRIFSQVKDSRRQNRGNFPHPMPDVLLPVVSGVLCGASVRKPIALFGCGQESRLRKCGEFNGVSAPPRNCVLRIYCFPSHSTAQNFAQKSFRFCNALNDKL